jgi:uncharacterized oxidoreductase
LTTTRAEPIIEEHALGKAAPMKLDNQTILITGGSSGIGLELATRLIALGNTVIVTGRDQRKLDDAKRKHPKLHVIASDAGNFEDVQRLHARVVGEFPDLSVLINNAGIMRRIDFNAGQEDAGGVADEIEINLAGPIRLAYLFLPHLKTKPAAAIMNVSSALAYAPFPLSPIYSAAKAGLHAFTTCLRVQLRSTNVRVLELLPPATDTSLLTSEFSSKDLGGVKAMDVGGVADAAIAGLRDDAREIQPGMSKMIKIMSRLAPGFLLKQMSATVD